jgi:hypothetical protein
MPSLGHNVAKVNGFALTSAADVHNARLLAGPTRQTEAKYEREFLPDRKLTFQGFCPNSQMVTRVFRVQHGPTRKKSLVARVPFTCLPLTGPAGKLGFGGSAGPEKGIDPPDFWYHSKWIKKTRAGHWHGSSETSRRSCLPAGDPKC